jgi:hypothetical protein
MKRYTRRIILVVLAATTAACSSGTHIGRDAGSNVVSATDSTVSQEAGTQAPSTAAQEATPNSEAATSESALPTQPPVAPRQDIKIEDQGFTQLPANSIGDSYVSYGVKLSNPNDPNAEHPNIASNVSLNITFLGADGSVVGSQSDSIDYILPGQVVADGDDAQVKGATKMEVQALVGSWEQNDRPITGTFTTSSVKTTDDGFAQKTIGSIHSTFAKDYKELIATALHYNAAGHIIGGAHDWIDFVPANGTASFSILGLTEVKGIAKSDVFVNFSSLALLGS